MGARLSISQIQKGNAQGGGHNVITIVKRNCNNAGVGLLAVHKQAIPFVRHSC